MFAHRLKIHTFVITMKEFKNISLKPYNSFGIDVSAERLIEIEHTGELLRLAVDGFFVSNEWNVLSGGNNILFTQDQRAVLIHPVMKQITVTSEDEESVMVRAEAGLEWDDFVEWCVERELWGVENLSAIPGYVGAAPVQNIGAYGVEAKDAVESVEMVSVETGNVLTLAREHCAFGYRDSIFKHTLKGRVIITAVNFRLSKQPKPVVCYGDLGDKVQELGGETLRNIRGAIISIRDSKLPDPKVLGNAGSFFKNPVVSEAKAAELKRTYESMPVYPAENGVKLAAGWLIDRCGWKGRRQGNVGVHERQALVMVNYGGASGEEILRLAGDIRDSVKERFGVDVEMEVNIL